MKMYKKSLSFVLLCLGVLVFLVGCTGDSDGFDKKANNGFSEGVKNIVEATTVNQEEEFLVYFYATSCPHCMKQKPLLNKYVEEVEGALPVYAYDLDNKETHQFVDYYLEQGVDIPGTPTMAYYYKGDLYFNHVGVLDTKEIPVKGSYEGMEVIVESSNEEEVSK